jgi:uncharacterized protein YjbI with pentapeptide repeats
MGELIKQGLLEPQVEDEERHLASLAVVQTDRILRRLAPQRKWLVLQFLQASSLISREAPIVDLYGADLREAKLCEYISQDDKFVAQACKDLRITADPSKYLRKSDLRNVLGGTDADLEYLVELLQHPASISANLASASLQEVVLISAYLRNATLSDTDLSGAYLLESDLILADLSDACLEGAWLEDAVLIAAKLNMANLNRVRLEGSVLVKAVLTKADLYEADLTEANLRQADLSGANLKDANLTRANLRNAKGVTQKQLERAATLEGATMPDGQKYEDKLKDKESRRKENSGHS